jgi:hypothetical protein
MSDGERGGETVARTGRRQNGVGRGGAAGAGGLLGGMERDTALGGRKRVLYACTVCTCEVCARTSALLTTCGVFVFGHSCIVIRTRSKIRLYEGPRLRRYYRTVHRVPCLVHRSGRVL